MHAKDAAERFTGGMIILDCSGMMHDAASFSLKPQNETSPKTYKKNE